MYDIAQLIFYAALGIIGIGIGYIMAKVNIGKSNMPNEKNLYTFDNHLSSIDKKWKRTLKNKCKAIINANEYTSIQNYDIHHFIDMIPNIPFKRDDAYYTNISNRIFKIIDSGDSYDVTMLQYHLKHLITTLTVEDFTQ